VFVSRQQRHVVRRDVVLRFALNAGVKNLAANIADFQAFSGCVGRRRFSIGSVFSEANPGTIRTYSQVLGYGAELSLITNAEEASGETAFQREAGRPLNNGRKCAVGDSPGFRGRSMNAAVLTLLSQRRQRTKSFSGVRYGIARTCIISWRSA